MDPFEQAKKEVRDSVLESHRQREAERQGIRPFEHFKAEAKLWNLQAVRHTPVHWQLRGGRYIVNYYPTTKAIYVNGAKGKFYGGFECAFKAAFRPPIQPRDKRVRRKGPREGYYVTEKKALMAKSPNCCYCKRPLTLEIATIEHVVPLSRGGADQPDNWKLACEDCNKDADERLHRLDRIGGKLKACRSCGEGIPRSSKGDFCARCLEGLDQF